MILQRSMREKPRASMTSLTWPTRMCRQRPNPATVAPNLRPFFAQWLNSTGVPDFTLDYVVYRTPKGFRIVGKIKQPIDTFSMPVQIRVDTEGNPETKWVDVLGLESPFTIETFGRPKPGGIKIDPNNLVLKGSTSLRARAAIARGEELAEQGLYYDAIKQYQRALSIQPGRPLANFRMGEAFFYQKNYQAAANSFREASPGRSRALRKMDRSLGPHLSRQNFRSARPALPRRQRIQQSQANQRRHRRRPGWKPSAGSKSLFRRRHLRRYPRHRRNSNRRSSRQPLPLATAPP